MRSEGHVPSAGVEILNIWLPDPERPPLARLIVGAHAQVPALPAEAEATALFLSPGERTRGSGEDPAWTSGVLWGHEDPAQTSRASPETCQRGPQDVFLPSQGKPRCTERAIGLPAAQRDLSPGVAVLPLGLSFQDFPYLNH